MSMMYIIDWIKFGNQFSPRYSADLFKIDKNQFSSINVETFSNCSAFDRSKGRSGSEDGEKDGKRLSEVGRVEGEDGKRLREDG